MSTKCGNFERLPVIILMGRAVSLQKEPLHDMPVCPSQAIPGRPDLLIFKIKEDASKTSCSAQRREESILYALAISLSVA